MTKTPDKVGFKNPPVHSRFKKGQSGNPFGRRKGSKNTTDLILKTLQKTVPVVTNGKKRSINVLEAMLTRLVHSGLQGNPQAIRAVLQLVQYAQADAARAEARKPMVIVMSETDM